MRVTRPASPPPFFVLAQGCAVKVVRERQPNHLMRLAALSLLLLLTACERQLEESGLQPSEPDGARANAAVATPPVIVSAQQIDDHRVMFHLATLAEPDIARMAATGNDRLKFLTIPGLLLRRGQSPASTPFSASFPNSSRSLELYPNTWLFQSQGSEDGLCVATAVGARSVLTAGHCVQAGATYTLKQKQRGREHSLLAECQSLFPVDARGDCSDLEAQAKDLAVCQLKDGEPDLFRSELGYQSIDVSAPAPTGQAELVTFTVCTDGVPLDKVNPIQLSIAGWYGPPIAHLASGKDVPANQLCPGDSGGPWLHGANSRVVALHVCPDGATKSRAVVLDSPQAVAFLKARAQEQPLCGISPAAANCRP